MNKSLLFVISFCSLCLFNGCGGGTIVTSTLPPIVTHFSVTPATSTPNAGTAFNFTVTALDSTNVMVSSYSGTVHFTSSDTKAVLPPDSALTSGTGTFSATLDTAGNQTITAADTNSLTGTSGTIAVGAPLAMRITSAAPPSGFVGVAYDWSCNPDIPPPTCQRVGTYPLEATGGVQPYVWSWAAAPTSSLPPGLNIYSSATCIHRGRLFPCGAILGTPAAAGIYSVVVTVTDSESSPAHTTANYTITITPPPLVISSRNPPDGVIGTAYSARLSSSGGTPPVTWSVTAGALPAGLSLNANTGAVTGTPTAVAMSSFTVQAVDSGTPQQKTTQALSITVDPPAVNNAELNGQYAFSFQGFSATGPMALVGTITADGAGNLTSGLADYNQVGYPTQQLSLGGTYGIYADNRGSFTLNSRGADMGTFRFAVGSISTGVANKARFVEFDQSGMRGAGVIEKQDPTAFSTAKITGDYAFGASSAVSSTTGYGAAGRFTAAGGNITSGSLDTNDQGTVNSNSTFTGMYSVDVTSRGTLTLSVTGSANSVNASFYVVSSSELLLISNVGGGTESGFSGTIRQQSGAGTFSNASMNGASVIGLNGLNSNGTADVVLGALNIPRAGNFTLAADENNGGTLQTVDQAGTYTVVSNGRVTVSGITQPPVFYLVGANQGFVVGTDSNATTGFFEPQSGGPFSNVSANGDFFFGVTTPVNANVSDDSGVVTFNGAESVTGTSDSSKTSGLSADQALADTYTISSSGRGTTTTSGSIFYVISPSKIVFIDGVAGASNSSIIAGEK